MAQPQLLQIKLSRFDAQPWGFRLQGGVDFAAPLLVQKVNAGSLAEKAGLIPGDAVIKINDVDVFNLRHKDAQDIVVRSGNNFVITVQRGGSTWRPHVTPTGHIPQPNQNSPYLQTVTKTSLAHRQQESEHIGCGYNNSARPFANGGDGSVKSIVNKQYNTPVGIYSDESIAETLSAQAEVLAGGVLGVNFKKNEKEYQADKSEVLKFLREEETGQSSPAFSSHQYQEQQQYQQPQQQSTTRHVNAPINAPKPPSTGGLPVGQNICNECERLITGVFVRIKDKNLHVECFKCATCGTSLKNQGYYNFNNKLYCDIHAKLAAMQNPPPGTEGYVPVPIKPNTKLSANTVSSALSAHGFNDIPVANGNSTPAAAPCEDICELPLPPPPSPTQLQQFESASSQEACNTPSSQTSTRSSNSSLSVGSSNVSNLFSTGALGRGGDPCGGGVSISTSLTPSLDSLASPLHSRQTSSCSSLDTRGGNDLPPPPPPPPPMPEALRADSCMSPKKRLNNGNTKIAQQHLVRQHQNENDMNTQNQNVVGEVGGMSQPQLASNAYNKLLKEYSNKLLTQNNSGNVNNNSHHTTHLNSNRRFNETAKPYQSSSINAPLPHTSEPTTNATNVAAVSPSLANQLKFNPCQVANSAAANNAVIANNTKTNSNTITSQDTDRNENISATMLTEPTSASDQPFGEYVTLTGNVIRSVVPPGKGVNINYKVNQGYARPYGAAGAPAAAPKSPVSYPPQPQQWAGPPKPAASPYATLPRTNFGQQELCTKPTNVNAKLSHKRGADTSPSNNDSNLSSDDCCPDTDSKADDPTAMLTESIGKINMGDKMNNFMAEAGKIISNMLEARLVNENILNNSSQQSSLRTTNSSPANFSRSPMVVRKRLDLEDFKDIDPTEPVSLQPVVTVLPQTQQQYATSTVKGQPIGDRNMPALTTDLPANHPMSKVLELCENINQMPVTEFAQTNQRRPPSPLTSNHDKTGKHEESSSLPPAQTVVYRNKKESPSARQSRGGELSTHAIDRRSYIEPNAQSEKVLDGPVFSVSVKALGRPDESDSNTPLSPENEEVVSQLLKDGKRPICCQCNMEITKGPFITALGRIWCPDHFICVNGNCRRPLQDIGFVEEKGDLYCEYCFEKYLAPVCSKCGGKIKGDCLNAIGKQFHPECFTCAHCGKLFGNTPFFLEDGNAYCEADWNELFTTKCFACGFPVEAGDRWVEALNHNYHSQCFNCTYCKQNLEGQSFYNKGGRPFCKNHAR